MSVHRLWLVVQPWALLAALATSAGAAEREGSVGEAGRAFARAEAAFLDDDYGDALTQFEHAFRLAPRAEVRFNIAVCLERLGRYEQALRAYRAAAASAELSPEDRARAAAHVASLERGLVYLSVRALDGVDVQVDGRACVTPCRAMVRPGIHRVSVRGQGAWRADDVVVSEGAERVYDLSGSGVAEGVAAAEVARASARSVGGDAQEAPMSASAPLAGASYRPASAEWRPRTLTYIGAPLAVAGSAVFAYFGARTIALKAEYEPERTDPALRERGLEARAIANVALGTAAIGVVLFAIDRWVVPVPGPTPAR